MILFHFVSCCDSLEVGWNYFFLLPIPSETPTLDDGEEEGVRLWHLVKAREESELPKHRKGSVRERGGERAKAIPEIYLTRLLFMKVKTLARFQLYCGLFSQFKKR